jgi:glycosyltransferase involved in cell wall biosynthesis
MTPTATLNRRTKTVMMKSKPEIVIATVLRDERGVTGVQTQFSVLRDYLKSIDYPVRVVTPFSYRRGIVYPVFSIRRVLGPMKRYASFWWYRKWHYVFVRAALRRVFAESDNVVVYAQDPSAARAALEARSDSQPVVLAMHSPQSEADEWVHHGVITSSSARYINMQHDERTTLSEVDRIVFASDLQRADVTAIYPELADKPSVVLPEFVNVPATRSQAPTRDIVTIGILESRKNHRFLIAAVGAAKAAGHRYTLTIVGEGPERYALEDQIRQLGLEDQVRLVGSVPPAQIGYVLEDHRLYAHTSRQESFGLAIIEAMSVGLPVLIGNVGGVAELLTDGIEARFWPDLDHAPHGAELLISMLESPAELEAIGERAAQRFENSFAIEVVAPTLLRYLAGS